MTSRCRSPWLVAATLAALSSSASAQDTPLYRDPSPTEGPRIAGPLLAPIAPRSSQTPPPPGGLGPFQPSNTGDAAPLPEPAREPLLGVSPMLPPLPSMPPPMFQAAPDVQIKRKTTIRPPHGPLGRCYDWFREAVFGPPQPTMAKAPKRSFLARCFHPEPVEEEAPPRLFNWPSWPTWPLSGDH
jgi:hypothetical protein